MLIHLIGPGGAGKTTTARLLKKEFGFQYADLDEIFILQEGDISNFIDVYGYRQYAIRNLEIYAQLSQSLSQSEMHIIVCSSGFKCYPDDISKDYVRIKKQIEQGDFTFLLLPSLDLETCVEEIVDRQIQRSYLNSCKQKETQKIRKRFPVYTAFKCKIILTNQNENKIALQMYSQINEQIALKIQAQSIN